jgi:cyclic beta-1,2-glucan synthetase
MTDRLLHDPVDTRNSTVREYRSADTAQPKIAILGSAPFTTILTNAGGGQTRLGSLAITRWRADATLDDFGQWVYLRDLSTGKVWSAAYQPVCVKASSYLASFANDHAVFHRVDGDIETRMEVAVSSSNGVDIRRVTITNNSDSGREIELTSFSEVVIAPASMDRGHPAFSNLFVQTEWYADNSAILAMRRPRSAMNKPTWCGHVLSVRDEQRLRSSCETDRAKFVGRGRSGRRPAAMDVNGDLSGRVGAVLDPVFAIRTRLTIPAGKSAEATFTTFIATDRDDALKLARMYNDADASARAFEDAVMRSRVSAEAFGVSPTDAALFEELAGRFLFGRYTSGVAKGSSDASAVADLKTLGLSETVPILLATIRTESGLTAVKQLIEVHRYWMYKGVACDLVFLATAGFSGIQLAADLVAATMSDATPEPLLENAGGIFFLGAEKRGPAEVSVLREWARMEIECDDFEVQRFLETLESNDKYDENGGSAGEAAQSVDSETKPVGADLQFFNGIGGFNDSREYELRLTGEDLPPAPWINVIANPAGGFIASETGAGPTWAINSSQYRLTPWQNDPVCDRPGECIYIVDVATGDTWTPTPAPIREATQYAVKHGAGYSVFDHEHDGIVTSLRMGVPESDAVKLQVLTLRNDGSKARKLSIVSYVEWVLGGERELSRFHIRTSFDQATGVNLANNKLDPAFANTVAFAALSEPVSGHTLSRRNFIGRNGTLSAPRWLAGQGTSDTDEHVADPCSALAAIIELAPGETKSIAVVIGAGEGEDDAKQVVERYRTPEKANAAIDAAVEAWAKRLGTITVRTPEPSFDLMLNQWAFYQALSCRVWGRIALFQSSGAYGFRDQLQDVTAFAYAEPSLAREQIVRAASRQFEEGDVQHWWHPHNGLGVRTRFADDLVWLPFVIDHYLRVTRDYSVLDERVPYLHMRTLDPDEDELYAIPEISQVERTVFEHCVHILEYACTVGERGMPLMKSGDWNDGMNRVGIGEKGESVWLGWFFIDTLRKFAVHADVRGETDLAKEWRGKAEAYREAVETSAWDGEWYRRAYYDDGTPLGSHANMECQIDSIAQSWSVISKAGNPERSKIAMESLYKRLVREDGRLIMLLTPPFDRGTHDPGYIQGYLPGVRENGAQYTHAALWAVLATALSGDGDRALDLFQMINPITHALDADGVATYKVEPYVVAADVYTAEGHLGRGGWTWYTGSASWLYRVGLEGILGFNKLGDTIELNPCIPATWKEFSIDYRYVDTTYLISVRNPDGVERGVVSVTVDGADVGKAIPLVRDGRTHEVVVTLGT